MSEMAEHFRAINKERRQKRSKRRRSDTDALGEAGIAYEVHNNGQHLIVDRRGGLVDYWPSSGLWIDRQARTRRGLPRRDHGVKTLIAWVKGHSE